MSTPPRSEEQRKAAEAALRRSGVTQPLWPALPRKAALALAVASLAMVLVSLVYVVASIACSWVLYFYNTMTEPWVFLWMCAARAAEYFGPPPPPTLTDRIVEAAENAQEAAARTVLSAETLSWLCGGTTVTALAYCCSIILTSYLRRTLWRFKGYEWEGLQPGSDFGSGRAPPCQVQISWLGALREKHSGYGIRCGQVLAVPLHVIRNQEQVLLTSHRGVKMVVPVQVIESATMNDVGYLQLSETAWSKLGVKDSTVAFTMGIASCSGLSGTSVGRVSRSSTLGLLTYKGSTVPGMSGAAYAINSQVCGMHVGMVRGQNAGVSMELIALELKKLTQETAIYSDDEEVEHEQPIWNEKDLKRVVAEAYDEIRVKDQWYEQSRKDILDAVRRGIAIDWAAEEAATATKRPRPKPRTVRFDYAQQSDDAPAAVLEVKTVATRVMDLEDEVSELRQMLEQVQGRLAILEGKREVVKPKPKEYLKCEFCDACTITAAGMEKHLKASHPVKAPKVLIKCEFCDESLPEKSMANHLANSHKPREVFVCDCGLKCRTELRLSNHKLSCTYKPESAFSSDFKRMVKQDRSFLGQRKSQRATRSEDLPVGSSKPASRGPSQSREEPQNELMAFLRNLNSTLEGLQKDMDGLTSAITQKFDH